MLVMVSEWSRQATEIKVLRRAKSRVASAFNESGGLDRVSDLPGRTAHAYGKH